jgi:hypothetical protein
MSEVAVSERKQYKQFAKTLLEDYGAFISVVVGIRFVGGRGHGAERPIDKRSEESAGQFECGSSAAGTRSADDLAKA